LNDTNQQLRDHLLELLRGGNAHILFEDLISDFPTGSINTKLEGIPYTAWQVLEHMRIAQWDILEFSRDANHVSPSFPDGYWPAKGTDASPEMWNQSVVNFKADLQTFQDLLSNPNTDLFARIPHGEGQTFLKEVLLVGDHNAYHIGVLTVMKRLLNGI
jgi:hypothetical protein